MNKWTKSSRLGLAAAIAAATPMASYAVDFTIGDVNVRVGSFLRYETALGTTSVKNRNNQAGNPFNIESADRTAYLPPTLGGGKWGNVPLGVGLNLGGVALPDVGFTDSVRRDQFGIDTKEDHFNYAVIRGETEIEANLTSELSVVARLRALYAPPVVDGFDPASVSSQQTSPNGMQGGISGGYPELYARKPDLFSYRTNSGGKNNPLEFAGKNYLVYFPAFVLDYHSGGLNVRVGNQQIAWGQSLFFRPLDIPNGLDLRRHLIIDRALEEFSDKRVPQLSIRATYQVNDEILADAYVAKFQPTIFGNPNTPYNVIPVQFTVHDTYDPAKWLPVAGIRFKADYGTWGWQAVAATRFGPEGTFRWTKSLVNKQLSGALGGIVNTAYGLKADVNGPLCPNYNPTTCRLYSDSGAAIANSPLEASAGGVYSADEWFNYAADVRLNGLTGLNAAIEPFAASQDLYASAIDLPTQFGGTVTMQESMRQARSELNTFFIGSGGSLRGHIERVYHREAVFGLGASYVNESEIDFLNQLIFNVEVQYTPNRTYTNTGLQQQFIRQDEYTVSIVMDKWHRLFQEFPGTYMVFQALTKNRADLVGRHLSGFGSTETNVSTGKGSNATYAVFGFLQPFPNKIFAVEFASLLDIDGGLFAQPLLQWNPGKGVTVEAFYNFVAPHLWGKPNNNLVETLNFAEEFGMRLAYQF